MVDHGDLAGLDPAEQRLGPAVDPGVRTAGRARRERSRSRLRGLVAAVEVHHLSFDRTPEPDRVRRARCGAEPDKGNGRPVRAGAVPPDSDGRRRPGPGAPRRGWRGDLAVRQAGEHPGDLGHAFGVVEDLDRRRPPSFLTTRRWRSAKHAICGRWVTTSTWRVAASRASRRPTASPARPADAGVDLVEHQRGDSVEVGEDAAAGQHGPGQLAARGALAERQRGLPGPAGEQQLGPLGPERGRARSRGAAPPRRPRRPCPARAARPPRPRRDGAPPAPGRRSGRRESRCSSAARSAASASSASRSSPAPSSAASRARARSR